MIAPQRYNPGIFFDQCGDSYFDHHDIRGESPIIDNMDPPDWFFSVSHVAV